MLDKQKSLKEKQKILAAAIKKVRKDLPAVSIWYKDSVSYADCVRSGLPSLDYALRTGGLPRGRLIELFGPEASGKTTLCLLLIKQIQEMGGLVAYCDAENTLDPIWASKLGVNVSDLVLIQEGDAHKMLEATREMVKSGVIDLVVVDSVAALVTPEELEGEIGDKHVAIQARLMSNALKVLNLEIAQTKTITIFTNQMRVKVGSYGNPETTSGGNALKFYASIRMEVKKENDEDAKSKKQHQAIVRIAKNKVAPPFGIGRFRIDPETGLILTHSLLDPAIEMGVIKKEAMKYTYKDKEYTGQTRLVTALEKSPELLKALSDDVYTKMDEEIANSKTNEKSNFRQEEKEEPEDPELEEIQVE